MMRRLHFFLIGICIFIYAFPAKAERLWLVVGASDASAEGIVSKTKTLIPNFPHSIIIQTSDCGDKKNVFAWVAKITTSSNAAHDVLKRLQSTVKDAYVKRCDTKLGTLLSLGIPAIDSSIANVPNDSVNWQDEDRISSAQRLPDGRVFVIVRHYVNVLDDPLEGRRERVIAISPPNTRVTLEDNCVSPGRVVVDQGRTAFHCAREQAGDHLLHNVLVFSATGKKLTEIQHCRNPVSSEQILVCESESVGADGKLILREKRINLAKSQSQ